jgi:hypothetical protein
MRERRNLQSSTQQRIRRLKGMGWAIGTLGVFILIMAVTNERGADRDSLVAFSSLMILGGIIVSVLPSPKPSNEILRLAQAHNGLLTLSEIATTLDIDPAQALRTLRHLQKLGVATQRWEELRKNLWEFPDYIQLPISQTLDLAKSHGGRVTLRDLVASGHSLDIASQTFDTLSEKGLAQQDPAAGDRTLIVQVQ